MLDPEPWIPSVCTCIPSLQWLTYSPLVGEQVITMIKLYSGRGKFMPLPLKSKILETKAVNREDKRSRR